MWPELYEGATFERKVFSNICLYSDGLYKTTWHCLKFHKSIFMNRSNGHDRDDNDALEDDNENFC